MKTQITFLKIDVGYKKSLHFYKDLLICLGYKIKNENDRMINFSNGETEFSIFYSVHASSSDMYIHNIGINDLTFKVPSKKVADKFYNQFLKPRKIKTFRYLYEKEDLKYPELKGETIKSIRGKYALSFETPEKITITVLTG